MTIIRGAGGVTGCVDTHGDLCAGIDQSSAAGRPGSSLTHPGRLPALLGLAARSGRSSGGRDGTGAFGSALTRHCVPRRSPRRVDRPTGVPAEPRASPNPLDATRRRAAVWAARASRRTATAGRGDPGAAGARRGAVTCPPQSMTNSGAADHRTVSSRASFRQLSPTGLMPLRGCLPRRPVRMAAAGVKPRCAGWPAAPSLSSDIRGRLRPETPSPHRPAPTRDPGVASSRRTLLSAPATTPTGCTRSTFAHPGASFATPPASSGRPPHRLKRGGPRRHNALHTIALSACTTTSAPSLRRPTTT